MNIKKTLKQFTHNYYINNKSPPRMVKDNNLHKKTIETLGDEHSFIKQERR